VALTSGRSHAKVTEGAVEKDQRKTLLGKLVGGWLVHTVASSLEMATGHDLQSISDVDHQGTGLVGNIIPLFITAPDLKTGNRDGEELCCQTEVSVSMHTKSLGGFLCLFLDWAEQGVAEIALASWASVRLNVVPQVIIG
jgi:hypothetical protein